jgi:prepilin-type N-terminal cleavage/methylation domain-containing protein
MYLSLLVFALFGPSDLPSDDIVPRCGQVALWTCLAAMSDHMSLGQIEEVLPVTKDGVSLFELQLTAQRLGFRTAALQWNDQLPATLAQAPAILPIRHPLGGPHFVAVIERREDRVLVVDFPDRGAWTTESVLRTRAGWNGFALHVARSDRDLAALSSSTGPRIPLLTAAGVFVGLACLLALKCLPQRRPPAPRAGFTMVELLVAMGIISLLVALALPAIQQSREQARRADCANRLRQIGIALGAFESVHGEFPGMANPIKRPTQFRSYPSFSELTQLLPHLDQATLHSRIQWDDDTFVDGDPPESARNRDAQASTVAVFRCPSDSTLEQGANYRFCTGTTPGFHQTTDVPIPGAALIGIVGRPKRIAEITDGASQTAFVSERLAGDQSPATYTPSRDLLYLSPNVNLRSAADAEQACQQANPVSGHASALGATWLFGAYGQTWYNHILPPNSNIPDCGYGPPMVFVGNAAVSARSWHFGGVNTLMGDGSVRFISERIHLPTWRALGTIAGHEVANDF